MSNGRSSLTTNGGVEGGRALGNRREFKRSYFVREVDATDCSKLPPYTCCFVAECGGVGSL